ncbi:MAG TPA: pyruvate:ferredoxin (flavodoxin) oxidoreductase [Bacillota bacterium]|nr:pyruvate:ferredoxin (flavodoxin) oxidoreductase [Bacillota bacterium]HOK68699.1 pyruvate:ferredoxin (flavodoxin) oxidoreductase [Bacillota bacterium]HPP85355.1 pyruvate:ferredoxin (flavodoxin) oxidoreductase [Bacillota bacterium]
MPRKKISMDGNTAAAHVAYAFTEVAGIYPITPSSVMAEVTDKWSAEGRKNIFGQQVNVIEMQSEAGAAGTVHGSLAAGALTTTFTASQGLLLMIPNMYKIAGELLPGVIHVSARAVASHALNIFGDHSDVMACRQTGFALLCACNPQEVMDLGAVAHLSAIKGRVPFLHFFDGFRTSHEVQKVEAWDYDDLKELVDMDAVEAFRNRALNPEHPVLRGTAQNPDIFFQAREACNIYYEAVPGIVEEYMDKINAKIGSNYKLFNYYGAPDAEKVIVAMGSVCDTIEETIDYLNARGEKVGLIKVRLYRPFAIDRFIEALPKTVKKIAVLDRTKEPGAIGEPLYLDVVNALHGTEFQNCLVVGGRYGLGSKDTTPACVIAVYKNLDAKEPINGFTVGITDDVTNKSLPLEPSPNTAPEGTVSCKFWGLGSDGTVGANKNSIKIIGDHTDKYIQAYFAYDSKKSGGLTISHLRFGDKPIRSTYYVSHANFVACHNPAYIHIYDITEDLVEGGTFLLNCQWKPEELDEKLPAKVKRDLARKKINFYIVDAITIAKELGLGGRTNTVLQSAFFKLAGIIPEADAIKYMKEAAYKSFYKKGEAVVNMNYAAIDAGANAAVKIDVPASWADAKDEPVELKIEGREEIVNFVKDILIPISKQKGDDLPVSAFVKNADGTFPQGSAAYEKRGVAVDVPEWIPENCIQCNFCSFVCPHATIRPVPVPADEAGDYPDVPFLDMTGMPGYKFAVTVSPLDCYGCGSCVNVCPGKKGQKALVLKPMESQLHKQEFFKAAYKYADNPEVLAKFKPDTVKGSQFKQPLLEFSGACAGCGETPYAKLITQLFGDRMLIANATGCSSIWGGSAPSTPYTVNKFGHGPAWANSLFEDNAEYGLGMALAIKQRRQKLTEIIEKFAASDYELISVPAKEWLAVKDEGEASKAASAKLIAAIEKAVEECGSCGCEFDALYRKALAMKDLFVKKSIWIFGGDGWAYDIGFGGLDHVIATGEDVNIFVFDTEVYSNTGGQASKATPTGSVAQFAASGKVQTKKDLAAIAMSYGYVYVAQVAMGADYNQCLKALIEAENYKGPSLVIGYAPCINHGIKKGLGTSMLESKAAVAAGYWNNFRYNPTLAEQGKNPFILDSKEPTVSYQDFIKSETRYSALTISFPEKAAALFDAAEKHAKKRYERLKKLAEQ